MRELPELRDQNSDQQDKGLQAKLVIDRDTASRMGITPQTLDNALYDAFGQRQVSTMYRPLNQYHVVMEVAPAVPADTGSVAEHLSEVDHRRRDSALPRSLTLSLPIRRSQ